MRRRDFITGIAGSAIPWPFAARAQQPERAKRVGMLMDFEAGKPEGQARQMAFVQGLQHLGWTDGNNVQIDTRWAGDNADRERRFAAELVALAPDVILASTSSSVAALQRVTHTVPIVFADVIDPVGAGFVGSLARPGGNTTGFSTFEYELSGKWLELLKQLSPNLTRVAVLRDPTLAAGIGQFAAIQAMAPPSLGVELRPIDVRDPVEIERDIAALAAEPNGGLIVTASLQAVTHRDLIIALATRLRLPNIYPFPYWPTYGGLASYGPNSIDGFAHAADYVDRILKGAKPADLPVQAPTKYELVVNLKTAKALGLTIKPSLLATADEVIE
jgi:putative tryptophan/tyrosine transport system substrate-binding protein